MPSGVVAAAAPPVARRLDERDAKVLVLRRDLEAEALGLRRSWEAAEPPGTKLVRSIDDPGTSTRTRVLYDGRCPD